MSVFCTVMQPRALREEIGTVFVRIAARVRVLSRLTFTRPTRPFSIARVPLRRAKKFGRNWGKQGRKGGTVGKGAKGRVTNNSRDFEPGKWLVLWWVSSRPVIDKPTYRASYAVAYYGAKRRAVPSV